MNQQTPNVDLALHSTGPSIPQLIEVEKKYLAERDKRMAGRSSYSSIDDDSQFAADPFAPEPTPRDAVHESPEHLVIGAGVAGVAMAARLRQAGFDDVMIVEKAGDFGGTWYWNRYPGIHCDTESYIYLPMLETVGYVPSKKYTSGEEIRQYIRKLAEHFDLESKTLFQTRVEDVRWDDESLRWVVKTDRGDELRPRHVMLASGGLLHRPRLPAIPGVETFQGHSFHASRWDYEYTGGDASGNMTNLADKRVAIIGTGATGIQAVPKLAEDAAKLYVFQRTPSIVDERNQMPTDENSWQSVAQKPGWQDERRHNFESFIFGIPADENLVDDQWSRIFYAPPPEVAPDGSMDFEAYTKQLELIDFEQLERIRNRVDEIVEDPKTAEALKPYFHRMCKRPCFSDDYLPAFNRPNVELVDTEGRGVERISENALHFGDRAYEVDVIIYATGFESLTSPTKAGSFEVIGRNGESLDEHWANGVRTMHGLSLHNFPNLYLIGNERHSAAGPNYPHLAEGHAEHVVGLLELLKKQGVDVFEVGPEGEEYWASMIAARSAYNEDFQKSCTPSYWNNEGKLHEGLGPLFADIFGGSTNQYRDELRQWREAGELERFGTAQSAQ